MIKRIILAAVLTVGLAAASSNEPVPELDVRPKATVECLKDARAITIRYLQWFELNGFEAPVLLKGPTGLPIITVAHKDYGFVQMHVNMNNWCVIEDEEPAND